MREYNTQNLVMGGKAHALTVDEQSNGGKASAEARRRKRDLRRALEVLLEKDIQQGGETITGADALAARLYKDALQGNVRAFEVLRDTVGQKPVENVNIMTADFSALDDAFDSIKGDSE